jgi:hypothetical protein
MLLASVLVLDKGMESLPLFEDTAIALSDPHVQLSTHCLLDGHDDEAYVRCVCDDMYS